MNEISNLFNQFTNLIAGIPFNVLLLVDGCAFGGIFLATLLGCVLSKKIRYADKRVFFHLLNAFSAITLALFCTRYAAPQSIAAAAIFWCLGYLLYGLLCALSKSKKKAVEYAPQSAAVTLSQAQVKAAVPVTAPAAQSVVRLDHALNVADKLLLKTLGRGDRQEIEKIKTALTVLKVKGELTPKDGETLNDMFNALLKLMAKYDL